MGTPGVKYEIIYGTVPQENSQVTVKELCEIAGVSRSGYYRWLDAADSRKVREEQDREDFAAILRVCRHRWYQKGARGIHTRLLHEGPPIRMNVKKIRRIMKKFGLFCPIRKANHYRRMERFYGHMKDEIDLSDCGCFADVCPVVHDWMDHYNNERYQWDLAKLSPNEFFEYCRTGFYPLPAYGTDTEQLSSISAPTATVAVLSRILTGNQGLLAALAAKKLLADTFALRKPHTKYFVLDIGYTSLSFRPVLLISIFI